MQAKLNDVSVICIVHKNENKTKLASQIWFQVSKSIRVSQEKQCVEFQLWEMKSQLGVSLRRLITILASSDVLGLKIFSVTCKSSATAAQMSVRVLNTHDDFACTNLMSS